ncbi:MAG: ATP-binding protein [Bacteroidales bacterium]|jgi:predicted AAA+ superfamily ATPase|nr:ATP-binding protein [Bacteroidales bacterium]
MKTTKNTIQRARYLSKIENFIDKSIVKVLVGHRRVGKSYLLFQLMDLIKKKNNRANIIYIDKENLDFDAIKDYIQLNDYIRLKQKTDRKNYIFVDEIQMISNFHIAIRSLALDENNDIYITGSNSEMLSSDIANELGGRYIEFSVYSLSYLEFLQFHQLENNDDSLEKYIHFGGLPYLKNLPLEQHVVQEYLRSIYATIILKDVVQRKNIRNSLFLEQLVKFLADNTGCLFSAKSISDYLKNQRETVSPNQISEYVRSLSAAFIVHAVGRYDIVGKRNFEIGEKYYFEDLGIRNVIAGYSPKDREKRLENLVFNHLIYCGYSIKVGTIAANEIDFVCERNGEKLYVQVAVELFRTETIEREFGNLLKINDNYPKMVVSGERSFENTYEGVQHIYIRDFLSEV